MNISDTRQDGIVVQNLTKRYDDLLVLDDISFNVRQGELLCIVGPTGCGKTTFMNTLARLIPATAGRILIHGRRPTHAVTTSPTSSGIDEPGVADGPAERGLWMEVKNVPRKEREVRLEHILNLVGLADCADLYPNQISASMEQRSRWLGPSPPARTCCSWTSHTGSST